MKYEYWFANIKGLSNKQKSELRLKVSCAKEVYYIEETALKKTGLAEECCHKIIQSTKEWNLEAEYDKFLKSQAKMITRHDKDYPDRLKEIPTSPYALYVKGKLPDEGKISVALVGARQCSTYGEVMAKKFAEVLAKCDAQIISGMARGIDSIGQRAALEAGGNTFAVLGCGVDVCYPREHYRLYRDIQEHGGIISEQPIGMQPFPSFFPARNRIISGLADVILVIEAKEKSGSLITADMALEQGKDVYALPGPVDSALSFGCHNLIKQGAGILLSPEDLMEELGIFHKDKLEKMTENKIALESPKNIVYSCLDFQPKSLNQILNMTGLEVPVLVDILIELELRGYIKEISKNFYVKVR